jgi:hypothetical protein
MLAGFLSCWPVEVTRGSVCKGGMLAECLPTSCGACLIPNACLLRLVVVVDQYCLPHEVGMIATTCPHE